MQCLNCALSPYDCNRGGERAAFCGALPSAESPAHRRPGLSALRLLHHVFLCTSTATGSDHRKGSILECGAGAREVPQASKARTEQLRVLVQLGRHLLQLAHALIHTVDRIQRGLDLSPPLAELSAYTAPNVRPGVGSWCV